ncbi:MAG TPA: carboxypeptidase-like regulatory domain-containing protein [Candidatus Thermoplasmatota archaeon]|nr:carboxypeptidase-like regulatory domain-containing protein [Candidatus Thermoplasmatota archaeon]
MSRAAVALLLFVALTFSGCTSGGAKSAPADTTAPPPTVSAEAGSIVGRVVDDEARPVSGAEVALIKGAEQAVKTDPEGKFTFNDLAPGPYVVVAQKLGYDSVSRAVTVTAGEVANVELTLAAMAVVEQTHFSTSKNGRIGCSYYATASWSTCPVQPFENNYCLKFNVTTGNSHRLAELVWQKNAVYAPDQLWLGERNQANTGWIAYAQGVSPVSVSTDEKLKLKEGKTESNWCVYIASSVGANLALDQPFTIHFTAFYNYEDIPDDFTALPK